VLERKVQIHRNTAIKANKAFQINLPENIGADLQEVILNEKDKAAQSAMIKASQKGKSVEQVKRVKTAPVEHEDETVSLIKEKSRLERTIKTLTRRLDEVAEQLQTRGEL
jgi:fructoselysine-6-P-deglycase FrlB-like protein